MCDKKSHDWGRRSETERRHEQNFPSIPRGGGGSRFRRCSGDAQHHGHHRSHVSVSIGYGSPYGYANPYRYGRYGCYDPFLSYYRSGCYRGYYGSRYYDDDGRRHHRRHHRNHHRRHHRGHHGH